MSVFNGEKYLREAVDSILNQTYSDFEFIIIDDGSTDHTSKILNAYDDHRIKILSQNNMGLTKSLNRGLRGAKGIYIARMDADDVSHPERLKHQVEFMDNHSNCVVLGTQAVVMREDGGKIYESRLPLDDRTLRGGLPMKCPFYHGSVMFRRDEAIHCGGYPEKVFHYLEDIIFWNRIARQGEFINLPATFYFYRNVPGSINVHSQRTSYKIKEIIQRAAESDDIDESDIKFINSLIEKKKRMNHQAYYYLKIGKDYLERTDRLKDSRYFLLKAIGKAPLMWNAWFNLGLSFVPSSFIKLWKLKRVGEYWF